MQRTKFFNGVNKKRLHTKNSLEKLTSRMNLAGGISPYDVN